MKLKSLISTFIFVVSSSCLGENSDNLLLITTGSDTLYFDSINLNQSQALCTSGDESNIPIPVDSIEYILSGENVLLFGTRPDRPPLNSERIFGQYFWGGGGSLLGAAGMLILAFADVEPVYLIPAPYVLGTSIGIWLPDLWNKTKGDYFKTIMGTAVGCLTGVLLIQNLGLNVGEPALLIALAGTPVTGGILGYYSKYRYKTVSLKKSPLYNGDNN